MATKRKVRRFAEGEFIDTESESGEWAGDEDYGDGTTRKERVAMAKSPSYKAKEETDESAMESNVGQGKYAAKAPKKAPVVTKEELAKSGLSLRDYMNKQQGLTRRGDSGTKAEQASVRRVDNDTEARSSRNTRTGAGAGEAAAYAASKMGGSGRGGQGGPTADELDAYAKSKKRPDIKGLMPSDENMQKGLEIAAGAPGLKAVASAAKSMANRAPAAAEKLREYIQPQLSAPTKRLTGPAAKEAATDVAPKMLPGPTRALPAPAKSAPAKESAAARSTRRSEEGYSPEEALKALKKSDKKAKKPLDESDTTGGATGYKKGGSVRGWGMARGARKAKIV
jgi:hypothetical protein